MRLNDYSLYQCTESVYKLVVISLVFLIFICTLHIVEIYISINEVCIKEYHVVIQYKTIKSQAMFILALGHSIRVSFGVSDNSNGKTSTACSVILAIKATEISMELVQVSILCLL